MSLFSAEEKTKFHSMAQLLFGKALDAVYTREELEDKFGYVWDTMELHRSFIVAGLEFPIAVVRSRLTGKVGSMCFQREPRFYFGLEMEE